MERLSFHNRALYFSVLACAGFLVVVALGPGLFHTDLSVNAWQYQIFETICHQDPARSYDLSGIQMAVCSRCLGIYGVFFVGWLFIPVYVFLKRNSFQKEKNWLIAAIILNLVDVTGNFFGIWTNSLSSRLVFGALLGLSLALILSDEFFQFKSIGVTNGK